MGYLTHSSWTLIKLLYHTFVNNWKKYEQITETFTCAKDDTFSPMQLIYAGKTDRCHQRGIDFPGVFNVTHTENHWSNKEIELVELVKFFNMNLTYLSRFFVRSLFLILHEPCKCQTNFLLQILYCSFFVCSGTEFFVELRADELIWSDVEFIFIYIFYYFKMLVL